MAATRYLLLPVFLLVTVGGGALIGILNVPGPWYEALQKPWFNPPNSVFGPVWTSLYILIGIAGWRIWRLQDAARLRAIWVAQLIVNFMWSPVFFTLQSPSLALVVLGGMLMSIIGFIAGAWNADRISALLFLPYLAWTLFAGLLNAAIVWLN